MIVRYLEQIDGSENDVNAATWRSRRLLLRKDGMGFSFHDTIMRAGTKTTMWYKNHLEAVYCIEGEGEIAVLESGEIFQLRPGAMYALNDHEKHQVRVRKDLRLICVFSPPCTGRETHDADGAYPLLEAEPVSSASK